MLTLVTCWPLDAITPGGPMRYLVFAEEAGENSQTNGSYESSAKRVSSTERRRSTLERRVKLETPALPHHLIAKN